MGNLQSNEQQRRPHEIIFQRISDYVSDCKDLDVPVGVVFSLEKTNDPDPDKKWKMSYACQPSYAERIAAAAEEMNSLMPERPEIEQMTDTRDNDQAVPDST